MKSKLEVCTSIDNTKEPERKKRVYLDFSIDNLREDGNRKDEDRVIFHMITIPPEFPLASD